MTRIIVELSERWIAELVKRCEADKPSEFATLEEVARDLEIPELQHALQGFGNPQSSRLIRGTIREHMQRWKSHKRSGSAATGLVGFYAVDVDETAQEGFVEAMDALDGAVASVVVEPTYEGAGSTAIATPEYRNDQRHLAAIGWDEQFAADFKYPVGYADLDVGWHLDHEALQHLLPSARLYPELAAIPQGWHGSQVLGIISGRAKIQGIAPNAVLKGLLYANSAQQSMAQTILDCLGDDSGDSMQYGDILLIEAEQGKDLPGAGLPIEVNPSVFRAIQLAVNQGIVVIEAAGNGHEVNTVPWDLDEVAKDRRLASAWKSRDSVTTQRTLRAGSAIPDSGAIIVSGCAPDPTTDTPAKYEAALPYNYGSAVDCYGWGRAVLTARNLATYGAYPGYEAFSGTSAASAVVTGVALLTQQMAQELLGFALSPAQLREVLRQVSCGTPVERNGQLVGILPHLERVRELLLTLPKIGVGLADPQSSYSIIANAPKDNHILLCRTPSTDPENDEDIIGPGEDGVIYVRVWNCGDADAEDVHAAAYWSEHHPHVDQFTKWHELEPSEPQSVVRGKAISTFLGPIAIRLPAGSRPASGKIDILVSAGGKLDPRPLNPPTSTSANGEWSRAKLIPFIESNVSVAMRTFELRV